MKKVKLAIVYQVIFHYRIPFYHEIEKDEDIQSILLHGSGVKGTKLKNSTHSLRHTIKLFSLRFPYIQNGGKKYFSFFPFLFFRLILINPDVVLIEGVTSIINSISTYLYAKLFGKKIIFWSLGRLENKSLSYPRQKIDRLILILERNADAIFTYSTVGEEYFLNRGIPKNKIFKGVNVLDTREILNKVSNIKKPKKEFRILFVGSIIPEKKLELLIEAFLELQQNYSNMYLDIIGSGGEYYMNLLESYNKLSDKIVFYGRITDGLEKYYFNSDIFVLPGLGGLAICESMAYGVPVICSSADGTEKDLIDEDCGFIIENLNKKSLYNKLDQLYNDRVYLAKCGENAKEKIRNEFSFENYYATFKKSLKFAFEN